MQVHIAYVSVTLRPDFLHLPQGRKLPGTRESGASLPHSHMDTGKKQFCRLNSAPWLHLMQAHHLQWPTVNAQAEQCWQKERILPEPTH